MVLLHVPTVGRNKLVPADLSTQHLSMLSEAVLTGSARHIFVPQAVSRLMHATGQFAWLSKTVKEHFGPLGILYRRGTKAVYNHLHFSVYGKFQERKVNEASAIGMLIDVGSQPIY